MVNLLIFEQEFAFVNKRKEKKISSTSENKKFVVKGRKQFQIAVVMALSEKETASEIRRKLFIYVCVKGKSVRTNAYRGFF